MVTLRKYKNTYEYLHNYLFMYEACPECTRLKKMYLKDDQFFHAVSFLFNACSEIRDLLMS